MTNGTFEPKEDTWHLAAEVMGSNAACVWILFSPEVTHKNISEDKPGNLRKHLGRDGKDSSGPINKENYYKAQFKTDKNEQSNGIQAATKILDRVFGGCVGC